MSYRLIVAEKPSVARDIARVLGVHGREQGSIGSGETRVTWCLGHLVELAEPAVYDKAWKSWRMETLPMLPDGFKLKARKGTSDQYAVVRGLMREASEVVNACDAGREGELIFDNVYSLSGSKAPVLRLWISSMTDTAIRAGFANLRDGEAMLPLRDAARCRSESDWLVGLNATRAMTLRARDGGGQAPLLSLGRVQTPTLAMMVQREEAIEGFVPEVFWQVKVQLAVPDGAWEALWNEELPDGKRRDRVADRAAAQAVLDRIQGLGGLVTRVTRKKNREQPPLLYDLTTLQKEANRRFRFSAQRTLELAQSLYEEHKVLSYPRTDSRHIGADQFDGLPEQLRSLGFGPYQVTAESVLQRWPVSLGKRVVDDKEVSDHHAIVPTGVDPRRCNLDRDHKRIFDLVARRFLAVFLPDAVFAVMNVDTTLGTDLFAARGRSCLDPGWRAIDPPKNEKKKDKEVILPPVEEGDEPEQRSAELHEGTTKPPRRYSEASLLGAMERAGESLQDAELKRAMKRNGLGTPATRAAIIETLLSRGYIERQERQILPTTQGRALISALPVAELKSPELTGEWEARLVAIAEGGESRPAFMEAIRSFTETLVEALRTAAIEGAALKGIAPPADGKVLGPCPLCGQEVRAARFGWSCVGCDFRLSDKVASRAVSETMGRQLLVKRRTPVVKGFTSRVGKPFSAALVLDDEGKVVFEFPKPEELGKCPECGLAVAHRGKIFTCETGRDCPFVVFAEMSGLEITDEVVRDLLRDGRSALLSGFRTKAGRSFEGVLEWRAGRVRVVRVDTGPTPAFGHRVDCPVCTHEGDVDPGYVIAGKAAWGCSDWKQGCRLRIPFEIDGEIVSEDEARRLLSSHRATHYMSRSLQPSGEVYKVRVVLQPGEDPCWVLERGRRR